MASELDLALEALGGGATAALAAWVFRLKIRLAQLETRQETIHSWLGATDKKLDDARQTLSEIVGMLRAKEGGRD